MSSEELSGSSIQQENVEFPNDEEQMPEANPNQLEGIYADETEQEDHTYVANPGQQDLEFNPEAYDCLLKFELDWPLLSIDFVNVQLQKVDFEADRPFYVVGGSQTDGAEKPSISVIELSNVQDYAPGDDPEEELEAYDIEPVFQRRIFDARSNITRIKSDTEYLQGKYVTGNAGIVAYWQESGILSFASIDPYLRSLSVHPTQLGDYNSNQTSFLPSDGGWCGYYPTSSNKTEQFEYETAGYALDFHPTEHLAVSGNESNVLHAFEITEDGKVRQDQMNYSKFKDGSIEDLHFAHTGQFLVNSVFGAVSTTGEFELIDPRSSETRNLTKISRTDLNVFDFDYADENLVYFGDEEGTVYNYDMREMENPLSKINYHSSPISSLKASPCNGSLIATSDDNCVCFWQFDCEDDESLATLRTEKLPDQFLFLHLGVEEVKEVAWCGQDDGYLLITDANGLQIIRGSNMCD